MVLPETGARTKARRHVTSLFVEKPQIDQAKMAQVHGRAKDEEEYGRKYN